MCVQHKYIEGTQPERQTEDSYLWTKHQKAKKNQKQTNKIPEWVSDCCLTESKIIPLNIWNHEITTDSVGNR